MAVLWLRSLMDEKADLQKILRSMSGYEPDAPAAARQEE